MTLAKSFPDHDDIDTIDANRAHSDAVHGDRAHGDRVHSDCSHRAEAPLDEGPRQKAPESISLTDSDEVAPVVFRVLKGRFAGAETSLPIGESVFVGRALRNTIVLRDPSLGDSRLRIVLESRAVARLFVEAGAVRFLGQRLEAPAEAITPAFTPFMIGDVTVAIGERDAAQWAQCEEVLCVDDQTPADDDATNDAAAPDPGDDALSPDADPWRGIGGWLRVARSFSPFQNDTVGVPIVALIAITVISAISLAFSRTAVFAGGDQQEAFLLTTAHEILNAPEYAHLTASVENNTLSIRGFLSADSTLASLSEAFDDAGLAATLDIATGDRMARAVEDIFHAGGAGGDATYSVGGIVTIDGATGDPSGIATLKNTAMRDVSGLTRLDVNAITPAPPMEATALQAFNRRIAMLSEGAGGYVVLDDGSRYFVGSTLPSGEKLVSVTKNAILIERDGAQLKFVF